MRSSRGATRLVALGICFATNRSDSDMFSFAYAFRPWMSPKVLSEGGLVREYVKETAQEYGVDRSMPLGLEILSADWSSDKNQWTITALKESHRETITYTCHFFVSCTGYYDYDQGHLPVFPGWDRFKGQTIHPQFWPENLDYQGQADRRDRQWRHGGHDCSGHGGRCCARHHVAAHTHLLLHRTHA